MIIDIEENEDIEEICICKRVYNRKSDCYDSTWTYFNTRTAAYIYLKSLDINDLWEYNIQERVDGELEGPLGFEGSYVNAAEWVIYLEQNYTK